VEKPNQEDIRLTANLVGLLVLTLPYLFFRVILNEDLSLVISIYQIIFFAIPISVLIVKFLSKYSANLIGKALAVFFLIHLTRSFSNLPLAMIDLAFVILFWFNGAFVFWTFAQAGGLVYRIFRDVYNLVKNKYGKQ